MAFAIAADVIDRQRSRPAGFRNDPKPKERLALGALLPVCSP
jgi:hypothetical protein